VTLHIFADNGAMLLESAGPKFGALTYVCYTGYRQKKMPGISVRLFQLLHIMVRPFSLRLSEIFVRLFNMHIVADPSQLNPGIARVNAGDCVLWINPTLSLCTYIDRLQKMSVRLSIYFVDPIHRLGLQPNRVQAWAKTAQIATYSRKEAARFGIKFLMPYAPDVVAVERSREFDIVYVGSPTPRRLLWVLLLQIHLGARGRKGHLRLASRSAALVKLFPKVFSLRVSFNDYVRLCAHSRSVLELHERDAGGVTLRATLCQVLGTVHLCNVQTTCNTFLLSIWRLHELDRFIRNNLSENIFVRNVEGERAVEIDEWLTENFT
jgi:hypothetical protein